MIPSTSTYSIQLDVTYPPSLDSFHIGHSKGWDTDVDKVGSCCIFSYTDMFQDPCGKARVQSVHSAAVSFWQVSYSHRILRNTPLYTCGPPCSRHSFWYKAWCTGTANRPFFLYIYSIWQLTSVTSFHVWVSGEWVLYHKIANKEIVNARCQIK